MKSPVDVKETLWNNEACCDAGFGSRVTYSIIRLESAGLTTVLSSK
jgi:hypothetical protein